MPALVRLMLGPGSVARHPTRTETAVQSHRGAKKRRGDCSRWTRRGGMYVARKTTHGRLVFITIQAASGFQMLGERFQRSNESKSLIPRAGRGEYTNVAVTIEPLKQ